MGVCSYCIFEDMKRTNPTAHVAKGSERKRAWKGAKPDMPLYPEDVVITDGDGRFLAWFTMLLDQCRCGAL